MRRHQRPWRFLSGGGSKGIRISLNFLQYIYSLQAVANNNIEQTLDMNKIRTKRFIFTDAGAMGQECNISVIYDSFFYADDPIFALFAHPDNISHIFHSKNKKN